MATEKYTAPIRRKSLDRVRFLREFIPRFVIADFVSEAADRAFEREVRRRKINVPPSLALESGASES